MSVNVVLAGLAGLGLLALLAALALRLAPSDPQRWHVDPATAPRPDVPGHYLLRPGDGDAAGPIFAVPPARLMAELDRIAAAAPRVERLAGKPETGHVTYVARSAFWGFPDYVSAKALPAEGGSRLAILSRLRFGHDDMGVNRRRVEAWLDALSRELTLAEP